MSCAIGCICKTLLSTPCPGLTVLASFVYRFSINPPPSDFPVPPACMCRASCVVSCIGCYPCHECYVSCLVIRVVSRVVFRVVSQVSLILNAKHCFLNIFRGCRLLASLAYHFAHHVAPFRFHPLRYRKQFAHSIRVPTVGPPSPPWLATSPPLFHGWPLPPFPARLAPPLLHTTVGNISLSSTMCHLHPESSFRRGWPTVLAEGGWWHIVTQPLCFLCLRCLCYLAFRGCCCGCCCFCSRRC